jgi:two-component system, chemotaxis family, chemotaxis protein CheY
MTACSLMIVDDSAIMRNRIARLCAKPGLEGVTVVAMAGDGAQALERAAQAKPDLITMDLTMPVMDGPACLRALRDVLPQARVLVVSALSDRATALQALTQGAHGFLLKPFSDQQLIESLQELMS